MWLSSPVCRPVSEVPALEPAEWVSVVGVEESPGDDTGALLLTLSNQMGGYDESDENKTSLCL